MCRCDSWHSILSSESFTVLTQYLRWQGTRTIFDVFLQIQDFNRCSLFATWCRTTWWTKETWWCMTALRRWRSLRTFNAWVRRSVLMEPKQGLNRDSFPTILYWIPWIKTTSSSSLDTSEVERHVSCWSTARRHAQVRGDWCYWRSVEGVSTCVCGVTPQLEFRCISCCRSPHIIFLSSQAPLQMHPSILRAYSI